MRRLSFILVLCLVLGLAGCGASGSATVVTTDDVPTTAEIEQRGLLLSSNTLPGGLAELTAMADEDGTACLAGSDASGGPVLGLLSAAGDFTAAELPSDVEKVCAVSLLGGEAKAVAEAAAGLCLLSFSAGGETECAELSAELTGKLGEVLGCAETGGALYILGGERIVKLDAEGGIACEALLPGEGYPRSILACGGEVYVLMDEYADGGTVYDFDAQTLEAEPLDLGELYPRALGKDAGGVLCVGVRDGEREYIMAADGGGKELLDWSRPGILVPEYSLLFEDKGGGWLLFYGGMAGLDRISRMSDDSRVELTLLSNFPTSELYALVNDFNTGNTASKLNVEYLPEDYDPARLSEYIAGADVLAFASADELFCLDGAELEDLLGYLDADGEYSRGTLVPELTEAMLVDGRLTWLPYAFTIYSFTISSPEPVEPGLSLADAEALAEAQTLPLFPPWMTQDVLWDWLGAFSAALYIDEENASCSFDGGDYAKLLELCAAAPLETPDGVSGQTPSLLSLAPLQSLGVYANVCDTYGAVTTYVGLPDGSDRGHIFSPVLSFAIPVLSTHKAEAWDFLRNCLGKEQQLMSEFALPASAPVLESQLGQLLGEGMEFQGLVLTLSEADAERFHEILEHASGVEHKLPEAERLMSEEAAACFAGEITAAEAAENTQRRVSEYLAGQN